jgi:hypothetical protein
LACFCQRGVSRCYSHSSPYHILNVDLVSICEQLSPSIVNSDNTLTR